MERTPNEVAFPGRPPEISAGDSIILNINLRYFFADVIAGTAVVNLCQAS